MLSHWGNEFGNQVGAVLGQINFGQVPEYFGTIAFKAAGVLNGLAGFVESAERI